MISKKALEQNFFPVIDVSKNVIRCADELNTKTIYTYFHIRNGDGSDVLTVSDDYIDDALAISIFDACPIDTRKGFHKVPFASDNSKFTHLIIANNHYFSDLNGRIDEEKKNCLIAIPVFNCEFAEFETPEDFYALRRTIVSSNDWKRAPAPKIKFRYDNAKTGAGTGDGYVFAKLEGVIRIVQEMGVLQDSFFEIINFRENILELLPAADGNFNIIYDRNDDEVTPVPFSQITSVIEKFVNE